MSRDVFAVDLDRIEALLPRYAMEGPRYTSYPTAPVWGDGYGPQDFREELARDDATPTDGLSVYVHVPFCRSLCHFCACNKVITRKEELPVQFLDTVERELDAVRAAVGAPRPASQVHWGGGTPTYLTPDQVTRLHSAVTARFPTAEAETPRPSTRWRGGKEFMKAAAWESGIQGFANLKSRFSTAEAENAPANYA